jgi:Tol biopolymer transport system component
MIATVDISKDGSKVLFTGLKYSDQELKRNIYIYDISLGHVVYSKKSEIDEFDPKFSHDGKSIVYCSKKLGFESEGYDYPSHIQVVNLENNKITTLTNDRIRSDFQPQFSWDDQQIVFDGSKPENQLFYVGDVYIYDVKNNSIIQLTKNEFRMSLYPAFKKDNETILININDDKINNVYLAEIQKDNYYLPNSLTKKDVVDYSVMFPVVISESKILCTVNKQGHYELSIFEFEDEKFEVLAKSNHCFCSPVYCQSNDSAYWLSGNIELFCMNLTDKKVKKVAGKSLFYQTEKWMKP